MTTVLDPTSENLARAAECIREGVVVVAPSDTNMALTVDPWNPAAVERAYEIKDRPAHKPLTLFVRDPDDWQRFGRHEDPDLVGALVEEFWPGPLNLVLECTDRVDDDRLRKDGTVSIGCLSNPVWRELVGHLDGPVAMTSANVSGTVDDDTLVDVETAVEHVGDAVDFVVAGEPQGTSRASTILGLADGNPKTATVLRRGDVTATSLQAAVDLTIK